jgi:hypothetical protein
MRQSGALICGYAHHKNNRAGVVLFLSKFKLKYLMPI